ncbi:MAG: hypothetical protein IK015_02885 [Treponema sp.]|nr:hypothetical protein [Treponema sp.]
MKDYYYLRSGYLHCVHPIDDAIKLTETEDNEAKQKIAATPSDKKQILENLWNHLIGENKNRVFNFTEYLDKKCHEKREYCRKLGI